MDEAEQSAKVDYALPLSPERDSADHWATAAATHPYP
jgi:hypothetical protein